MMLEVNFLVSNKELADAVAATEDMIRNCPGTSSGSERKAKLSGHFDRLLAEQAKRVESTITIDGPAQFESTVSPIRPAEEKAVAAAQVVDNLEWSDTLLDGKAVNYKTALAAAEALGERWRLPTRFELESLLDLSRHNPAIDTEKFPDTKSTWYWTSSECSWNDSAVWVVGFGSGFVYSFRRSGSACVRAVRAGQ